MKSYVSCDHILICMNSVCILWFGSWLLLSFTALVGCSILLTSKSIEWGLGTILIQSCLLAEATVISYFCPALCCDISQKIHCATVWGVFVEPSRFTLKTGTAVGQLTWPKAHSICWKDHCVSSPTWLLFDTLYLSNSKLTPHGLLYQSVEDRRPLIWIVSVFCLRWLSCCLDVTLQN